MVDVQEFLQSLGEVLNGKYFDFDCVDIYDLIDVVGSYCFKRSSVECRSMDGKPCCVVIRISSEDVSPSSIDEMYENGWVSEDEWLVFTVPVLQ